ncbi:hypothetical protein B0J14DRAFT_567448 [Halenospora varia]|nr:hypothetical protein B0J14DRAFT_567448 [Halenospora varia]
MTDSVGKRSPPYASEGRMPRREGEKAIDTAFKLLRYKRQVAHRKGFSDNHIVKQLRVDFAREAITWSRRRLYRQMFSDEVWAMGGAHTSQYRTVKTDGSKDYNQDSQHKYSKVPA